MKRFLLIVVGITAFSASYAQKECKKKEACCKTHEKQPAVVIRQSTEQGTGTLRIDARHDEKLHFYLFDLEGTLISQVVLNSNEKSVVNNIKKGTYIYTVFANDTSIEEGKLTFK